MDERCDCCEGKEYSIGDALSLIAQARWHITAVMAGSSYEPPFAYSTGLTSLGQPELIVYGLPQQVSGSIINMIGERLVAGEQIAAGSRVSKEGNSFDLMVIEAADTADMLETASLYPQFRALQVVFPDKYHVFPWEPGYSLAPWVQPLMGEAPV